jgi:glycosyltransferase involved in cell wall biosynthesis
MSRPIRVLLIAPSFEILGGQSVQASRLMKCLGQDPTLRMAFQPINPHLPGWLRQIKYARTLATFLLYISCLLGRAWKYDILHVFSASYYSYSLWTLPALFFAKLYGKKIILNYRDGQAEDHLKNWRSAIPTIRRMDALVTPSGFLVDVFAKFGLQAQSIFNIIEMDKFKFRQRSRLRPIFLHNRILEPLYNIKCALRAFSLVQSRYPEATLTVAHDGPSRPGLEKFAHDIGLLNTTFVGRIPHPQVPDLYDSVDLYITTPDFDCMPGSLLECFASGLPVIATAAGGIPYIATHMQTALLVDCNDHQAMANWALRLLDDEELVRDLTARAFEECKRYSPVTVQKQWSELYHKLVR